MNWTVNHRLQQPAKAPPPPPLPPPPRKEVDDAVRQPKLHGNKADAPPPERYVQHEVQRGETMTEISHRYQTNVPMLEAANPQIANPDEIEIGQKVNVPIGAGYGTEPTRDVAEPGQTLTDMAREHPGVSARDIARANRADLSHGSRVQPGQELWIPAQKPATPLEQKVQATDQAQAALDRAQQAYDELPPDTHPATRQEVYQGVQEAKGKLTGAVREELDVRAKQVVAPEGTWANDEDRYAAAGAQLKERYQADAGATQQLDAALDGLAHERHQTRLQGQANAIVDKARNAGDAQQQMASLNESLQAATPEVREAVTRSQGYRDLLQGAADWAMEPLSEGYTQKSQQVNAGYNVGTMSVFDERVEGQKAAARLDQLTKGLSPELAAELVDRALPKYEAYDSGYKTHHNSRYDYVGDAEMSSMLRVLDRAADTEQGQANIKRVAGMEMMWNAPAVRDHIAQGGRLEFALAYGKKGPAEADVAQRLITEGMGTLRERIGEKAQAYSEHMSELGWLVHNHGDSMTPEQLQAAIDDYTSQKGPDWEAKGQQLQNDLADQGEALFKQLNALPADFPGREDAIADALNDPAVGLALNTAWEKKPELMEDQAGGALAFFADPSVKGSAKLTDIGRRLFGDAVSQYMKRNVTGALETFDPDNPASVAATEEALDKLRNSKLAKILGVSQVEMDDAVKALKASMPEKGDTADDIARKMSQLDTELNSIGSRVRGRLGFDPADANRGLKAFDKSTVAGQLMRGAGMFLGGVGLLASTGVAMERGEFEDWLKVAGDGLGMTNKGLELAVAMGRVNEKSLLGKAGGSMVGRVLGAGMTLFDAWNAYEAINEGDYTSATLYGAGAVGGLAAALFTGPVGWVGLGLMGISAVGLWVRDGVKESRKHEPDQDGGVSTRFLKHAGINEDAARALNDQSGKGYNVMPLLNRYAEIKGLNLDNPQQQAKFIEWINAMTPEQLAILRNNLHRTADKIEGDWSQFNATADTDRFAVPDISNRPHFTRSGGRAADSVAQLEAQLQVLGIPLLAP